MTPSQKKTLKKSQNVIKLSKNTENPLKITRNPQGNQKLCEKFTALIGPTVKYYFFPKRDWKSIKFIVLPKTF
jgi:hypothetical protein